MRQSVGVKPRILPTESLGAAGLKSLRRSQLVCRPLQTNFSKNAVLCKVTAPSFRDDFSKTRIWKIMQFGYQMSKLHGNMDI